VWGTIIGPLVGLGLAFLAAGLTVTILYKATGEQHAVGPAFDGGIVFVVSAPLSVALGVFVGGRLDRRRIARGYASTSIPPRPD
jgi:hypothetical protein